jgi:hypothetical protein
MWRGVFGGVLTLIVMQAFSSGKGPEQAGKLGGWIATGLQKALSPDIAAIPRRKTATPASTSGTATTLPRNPVLTT